MRGTRKGWRRSATIGCWRHLARRHSSRCGCTPASETRFASRPRCEVTRWSASGSTRSARPRPARPEGRALRLPRQALHAHRLAFRIPSRSKDDVRGAAARGSVRLVAATAQHQVRRATPMMRLFRVILPIDDLDRAATFYAALLSQPGARISPGRHYFSCGDVTLALYSPKGDGDAREPRPNFDHVYFAMDDLEEVYQRARALAGYRLTPVTATCRWVRSRHGRGASARSICATRSGTRSVSWTRAPCSQAGHADRG